jgi:hypothetical protein
MTLALFATLAATLAQTAAPVVPGFGSPWFVRAPQRNTPVSLKTADQLVTAPISACNIRTIVAPSHVDPKIVVEPPKDVRHSVRIIELPCR